MGEITDALRSNLRELALSDARLLRELDAALPGGSVSTEAIPAADRVASLDDGLDRLSLKELKELCKQRRLKGITKLKKDELIALLRGGGASSPAALPAAGRTAASAALLPAAAPDGQLASLEARLERMEGLLQRIASQLGVS
jgi:hypothetical protein